MAQTETDGLEVLETREWVDSLDYVLSRGGPNRAGRLVLYVPKRRTGHTDRDRRVHVVV